MSALPRLDNRAYIETLKDYVEALKDRLDCFDLAAAYGLKPASRSKGKWRLYHRPGQIERKPSFGICRDGWKDFATGEHGDQLALIAKLENTDFKGALIIAEAYTGLRRDTPIKSEKFADSATTPLHPQIHKICETTAPCDTWQRAAMAEIERCEALLWSPVGKQALEYLRTGRGFTDETIRAARFGYNPTWHKTSWTKDNGKPAQLAPGITIPCFEGETLHYLKVRCRVGNLAKALGIPEDTNRDGGTLSKYIQLADGNNGALYVAGIQRAVAGSGKSDKLSEVSSVVLVEGEFDAWIGNQHAGDTAIFATFGSASTTPGKRWIERLQAARVQIGISDNDDAGKHAGARWREALSGLYLVSVPTGKDLTDFALAGGDVRAWIDGQIAAYSSAYTKSLPTGNARRNDGLINLRNSPAAIVSNCDENSLDGKPHQQTENELFAPTFFKPSVGQLIDLLCGEKSRRALDLLGSDEHELFTSIILS